MATEAFHGVLGVKEDKKGECLGSTTVPRRVRRHGKRFFGISGIGGAERVGLMVSDGLTGLETTPSEVYPTARLQRCVTHLKRNMLSKVRHGDKMELAEDLRGVFRTGQKRHTREDARENWTALCEKWGKDYRSIKKMGGEIGHKYYFTYLQYHHAIQSMIHTTNRIERLNTDRN